MRILNIAGYKFISLNYLSDLQPALLEQCRKHALSGTILLSHEGININLAGLPDDIHVFITSLKQDKHFTDMRFHETWSDEIPFRKLKVKIKKEIITLRQSEVDAVSSRAADISPGKLRDWLNENRDITLLDTRNDYEIRFGSFKNAKQLQLHDFSELPASLDAIPKDKPVVMFCTGGIRCEKAAIYMLNQGYKDVYQLDGGILGYFQKIGGEHYEGECFVFDERVALDCNLLPAGVSQCKQCHGRIAQHQQSCSGCSNTI